MFTDYSEFLGCLKSFQYNTSLTKGNSVGGFIQNKI